MKGTIDTYMVTPCLLSCLIQVPRNLSLKIQTDASQYLRQAILRRFQWNKMCERSDDTALHKAFRFLVRWFKFTLKPPYSVASENFLLAIWHISHWNSFVKFGLKTAWDISYDTLWPLLKYVNFWWLQGCLNIFPLSGVFRMWKFFQWGSEKSSINVFIWRWAGD